MTAPHSTLCVCVCVSDCTSPHTVCVCVCVSDCTSLHTVCVTECLSQGADYVEFDVQLTRDLIPVVYHDFTVCTTLARVGQGQ